MTAGFQRAVLMGDPAHFQIRGGANPHTRDRWGRRRTIDRGRAREQWDRLVRVLSDHGVKIHVVPAVKTSPGMVFPANAGFLTKPGEKASLDQKIFLLSRPLPSRNAERKFFGDFIAGLGFAVDASFPKRFEGEADLFPAGNVHIFSSGLLETQRFVPALGWPPYRRVYGFRSDAGALEELKKYAGSEILPVTLVRETHYHGDTCLCSFGPKREFLMAYLPALSEDSQSRLKARFQEKLVPLSAEDGECFAANSFQIEEPAPVLFMPAGASARLQSQVRERGVRPVTVDVSEFMSKGGGSVKCMVGDLGYLPQP